MSSIVEEEARKGDKEEVRKLMIETLSIDPLNFKVLTWIKWKFSKIQLDDNLDMLNNEIIYHMQDEKNNVGDKISSSAGSQQNYEAGIAYNNESYEHACELYNEAVSLHPNNAIFLTNRSACHMKLGNFYFALDDALKAIEVDGKYWKGYARAINVFITVGYINQADEYLDKFQENVPEAYSLINSEKLKTEALKTYQAKADEFYNAQNFENCLESLGKSMEIATNCDRYDNMKAGCLSMLGNFDEAKKIINKALLKNADNIGMLFNKGLLEYYASELEASVCTFNAVLSQSPDFIRAKTLKKHAEEMISLRAEALKDFELRRFMSATEKFSQAILIDSTNKRFNCEMFYQRGCAKLSQGNFTEALDDFNATLRLDLEYVDALSKRAHVHYTVKEFEEALIDCEEYLKFKDSKSVKKLMKELKVQLQSFRKREPQEVLGAAVDASRQDVENAYEKFCMLHQSENDLSVTEIEKRKKLRKMEVIKSAYDMIIDPAKQARAQNNGNNQESRTSSADLDNVVEIRQMISAHDNLTAEHVTFVEFEARNCCESIFFYICCCCRRRNGYEQI